MGGVIDMADQGKWVKIGSSATSPVSNTQRKEVFADTYYLVVGFEVNKPSAYKDRVHVLDEDYGHAFFYTTKNATVTQFFSFGPAGVGKVGWFNSGVRKDLVAPIKDGYADSRPGTAEYGITENIRIFKVDLTANQAERVIAETNKVRQAIISGKQQYTAWVNDTCAETAKEILDDADIKTPSGSGPISQYGLRLAYGVNPYRWHENFVKAGIREVLVKDDSFPKDENGAPSKKPIQIGSKDAFYDQLHNAAQPSPGATPTAGAARQAAQPVATGDPFRALRATT